MNDYSETFDWVQFPEGRARFAGGTRGWDESGHETFAVEVGGVEYFGEIDQAFLPNGNDFNIEIVSFGLPDDTFAGSTPASWKAFTNNELVVVQSLVAQLIQAGLNYETRPLYLRERENSKLMGKVLFRNGWALQKEDDNLPAKPACSEGRHDRLPACRARTLTADAVLSHALTYQAPGRSIELMHVV